MAKKPIGKIILIIALGAIIGSLLGQLLSLVLPEGVVKEVFIRSGDFGFSAATLELGFIALTIGFKIRVTIAGIIGVAIAIYMLRWY